VTEEDIKLVLQSHCLKTDVAKVPRGHLRIGTHMKYFDGSGIDLFACCTRFDDERGELTDFGQTLATLAEHGVKWTTREDAIQEAIKSLKVRLVDDRLYVRFQNKQELAMAVINLSQACVKVSCLAFARKSTKPATLVSRVGDAISFPGLSIDKNYKFVGPYQKKIKVDYRVVGRRMSAVIALGSSHTQANEVYRRWVDLKKANISAQFLTIYDNERMPDYPEDLKRIHDISEVLGITDRDEISEFLNPIAA